MSVEDDLEEFKYLALEEQIKIPYYLKKYESAQPIYEKLDPILAEIVGDCRVAVCGEVYIPDVNKVGHNIGQIMLHSSELPLIGSNNGVNVSDRKFLRESDDNRYIVGYSVGLDRAVKRRNALEYTESRFFAFAPVESSQLHVPDLELPEDFLLPKADDEFAAIINEALQGEQTDFQTLVAVFDKLQNHKELEQWYYLSYLNRIFPLAEYQVTVVTSSMVQETDEDTYYETLDIESSTELTILPSHFESTTTLDGLCIVFFGQGNGSDLIKFLIPLSEVSKLRFEHKK